MSPKLVCLRGLLGVGYCDWVFVGWNRSSIGRKDELSRRRFEYVLIVCKCRDTSSGNGASDTETRVKEIEDKFKELTARNDIAIILINQHVSHEL